METTDDVYNSINRYFHTLSVLGYKGYTDVYRLLIYIFLDEILHGDMSQYITENDYNDIDKALYCMYGTSCTIPYPSYRETYVEPMNRMPDRYRISESGIMRSTGTDNIRTMI